MVDPMDWMDKEEERRKEERSKDYFNFEEGDNKFQMMTHAAPYAQVWDNAKKKYRPAVDGDTNISIRGVCWVLQEGVIKLAELPYTVLKQIRAFQSDPEWEFDFPFENMINVRATKAGSKEVEYQTTLSPKKIPFSKEALEELTKKPTPEEMVEKKKGKAEGKQMGEKPKGDYYPKDDINPDDIPF